MATPAILSTDVPALARLQQRGLMLAVVGLVAGAIGAFIDREQFFQSWLIGFLFCLGMTLGCLGLLMLQHLSGGQWGMVGRRVFEAAARTLPLEPRRPPLACRSSDARIRQARFATTFHGSGTPALRAGTANRPREARVRGYLKKQ